MFTIKIIIPIILSKVKSFNGRNFKSLLGGEYNEIELKKCCKVTKKRSRLRFLPQTQFSAKIDIRLSTNKASRKPALFITTRLEKRRGIYEIDI